MEKLRKQFCLRTLLLDLGFFEHEGRPLLPFELFGGMDSSATAAEGIKYHIALVTAGANDTFEEGERFLCGVAEIFIA